VSSRAEVIGGLFSLNKILASKMLKRKYKLRCEFPTPP
jgi:hypothetical protein